MVYLFVSRHVRWLPALLLVAVAAIARADETQSATANINEFTYGSPSFSPDSQKLVFDRCTSAGKCAIHILNITTKTLTYLQAPEDQVWFSGKLSPSGQQIVFVAVPLRENGTVMYGNRDYENAQIAIMDSDGRNFRMLTSGAGYKSAPNFSWSGKKVVFVQGELRNPDSKSLAAKNDAYEIDLETISVRQITDSKFFQMGRPSYLPSDTALVVDADAPSRLSGVSDVEALWRYRAKMETKYNHSRVNRFAITKEFGKPALMFGQLVVANSPGIDANGQIYFLAQPSKTEAMRVYRSNASEEFVSWERMKHLQTRATAVSPNGRFWVEVSRPSLADDLNGIYMLDLVDGTWREISANGQAQVINPH